MLVKNKHVMLTLLDSRELNQKWVRKRKKETEITQSITHIYKVCDGDGEKNVNKLVSIAREEKNIHTQKWKIKKDTLTRSLTHLRCHTRLFVHS